MKRNLLFLVLVIFPLFKISGQDPTFVKGDKVLNLGIGIGSAWYTGYGYSTLVPPISGSFEFGVADNVIDKGTIGVGAYLGYFLNKYTYPIDNEGWKFSNLYIGARGNFHYPLVDKLDTYLGLTVGINTVSESSFGGYTGPTYTSFGGLRIAGFIGARYYFKESFAVMGEIGYGVTYLNLGVAFKF